MFIATCGVTPRSRQSATKSACHRPCPPPPCAARCEGCRSRIYAASRSAKPFASVTSTSTQAPPDDPSARGPCSRAWPDGPSALRNSFACGSLRARHASRSCASRHVKSTAGLRPGPGGSSLPSRRRMLLTAAQDSISVPSTLKCSFESNCAFFALRTMRRSSFAPPSPRSAGRGSW